MTVVHCKQDAFDVYIGRPSKWGNSFVIGQDGTRAEVIEKYRLKLLESPELLADLHELEGKVLGCWCAPQPCHGDVLESLIPRTINYFGTGDDAGDHSFLSNFYWHADWTVEHHYQAAKTVDPLWVYRILKAPTPGAAKKLGRNAPLRAGFEEEKRAIMLVLLRLKFTIPSLRDQLLTTGNAQLVEGNWWGDRYWGVDNRTGIGENWLGRLLMQVRKELTQVG